MSTQGSPGPGDQPSPDLLTDFLILSDGTLLAHNLTPAMAAVVKELSPDDEGIRLRASTARKADRQASGQQAESECSHDVPE